MQIFYKYDNIISENLKKKMKGMDLIMKKLKEKLKYGKKGITLIALVITILFSYDEELKFSNSKGFLLQTI